MKVLIVNNAAPFVWGGAEELAENLKINLQLSGHRAEILKIPFAWSPSSRIPDQVQLVRNLELSNVDKVIALKFPAYLIRHPEKTLWLLHQYRQAYDLFDAGHSDIPRNAWGDDLRTFIHNSDQLALSEMKKIYCNSEVTQARLRHYNHAQAEVLYPPVNDPTLFTGGPNRGYIFAGGRVNAAKRQGLLVRALAKTKTAKLVIAGPPDSEEDALILRTLVEDLGVSDRVSLDLRFLSRTEYADYVNNSAAVAYIPFDEDSLGYVSMEASLAAKPVITSTDSGGILRLVKDGVNGWVSEPDAGSLADTLEEALRAPVRAADLGVQGRTILGELDLTWAKVISKLLA